MEILTSGIRFLLEWFSDKMPGHGHSLLKINSSLPLTV
jgi:hypothetical protein